jgi:hypothetical protein
MSNFVKLSEKESGLVVEFRRNLLSQVNLNDADDVVRHAAAIGYRITGRDAAVLLLGGVHRTGNALLTFSNGRVVVWKSDSLD